MRIRPIRTRRDHEQALATVEQLWDAPAGSDDADDLEVLAVLIDAYESEQLEIAASTPAEAILFRAEQMGLSRADLQSILGVTRGRLSEVLNGKRELSKAMIRRLVERLDLPAEVLIGSAKALRTTP